VKKPPAIVATTGTARARRGVAVTKPRPKVIVEGTGIAHTTKSGERLLAVEQGRRAGRAKGTKRNRENAATRRAHWRQRAEVLRRQYPHLSGNDKRIAELIVKGGDARGASVRTIRGAIAAKE
jgi:hypothetical protein